jgi:two-component system response regulator HydG
MPEATRVLIVDDDRDHADAVADGLTVAGFETMVAHSADEGLQALNDKEFEIVVADLVLHDGSGLDLLRHAKAKRADIEVIVVTGYPSYETAIQALNEGAYDYIDKPVNLGVLRAKLRKALEKQKLVLETIELRKELNEKYGFQGIVGNSPAMREVFETLKLVAESDSTVLIEGESGTGKELIARAVHSNSSRRGGRFVAINCASLPENLLESELFGHEKGAFTGAVATRKGRFEYAQGGTLFLDEIGDMPLALQAKFLRAVEYGEITRIGSNDTLKVNVRIIAATHRDLEQLVKEGKFREDLFYRINVVRIDLPPLRERLEDMPVLIDSFIKEFAKSHGKTIKGISQEAMAALYRYSWPGNVRELRNCIESMIVLSRDEILDLKHLPRTIAGKIAPADEGKPGLMPVDVNMESAEKEMIKRALVMTQGNREKAAQMLGIGERTLYRKIKRYGL